MTFWSMTHTKWTFIYCNTVRASVKQELNRHQALEGHSAIVTTGGTLGGRAHGGGLQGGGAHASGSLMVNHKVLGTCWWG